MIRSSILLAGQQPAREKRLHLAPAVSDQVNVHSPALDAIDDPVRLEESLAVIAYAQCKQLSRLRAACRMSGQSGNGGLDPIGDMHGPRRGVVNRDPIGDLLEVGER